MRYVVTIAMVALLLLGACSSGSVETSSSVGGSVDLGKGSSDTAGSDDAAGGPAGGSALDTLKEAMGARASLKYTADYEMQSPGAPKMTQTWAFDLPRMAIKTKSAEAGESWSIIDSSKVIVCSRSNAEWQCFKVSNDQAPTDPSEGLADTLDDAPDVALAGACTRAGLTGVKYKVEYQDMSSSYCVTTDGILLETEAIVDGQKTSQYATRVVRSVSASDFTPPAEPIDMADFQARAMAGAGLPDGFEMPTS